MSEISVAESGARPQNVLDCAGLRGFPWTSAIILYSISWGWLFIVRDSLWADDWQLFGKNYSFPWRDMGFAPWADYNVLAAQIIGLTLVRVVVFVSFFASAIMLFGITQKIGLFDLSQNRLLILLFLILPFNTARVAPFVFLYTNSYLLFFAAWYLTVRNHKHNNRLSQILFFLSFQMHSLLAFHLLPVIYLFIRSKIKNLRGFLDFLRMRFVIILLPLVYWILRSIFWTEKVNYHDVTILRATSALPFVAVALIICGGLGILRTKVRIEYNNPVKILLSGFIALFAGLIAYVVLGFFHADWSIFQDYFITLFGRSDWYSRHQTLQPLGAALLIVGVIALLQKRSRKFSMQVQIAVLSLCVVFNIGFGFEYVVDYAKQREVVTELKKSGESESISGFTIIDQTAILNARGRTYRYRDWQGLISLAFDSELQYRTDVVIEHSCSPRLSSRLVLIKGPETHWRALKNWVSNGDIGFNVTVDDTPGACKPEMVTSERDSGAIPILFYFTGANG